MKKTILLTALLGIMGFSTLGGCAQAGGNVTAAPETKQEAESTPSAQAKGLPEHDYPESLLEFLAKEKGEETAYLTESVKELFVNVDFGVQSQPLQTFTDEETLRAFLAAVENMTVEGIAEESGMEDLGTHFRTVDENGETVFSFTTQNGYLDGSYHLYTLKGFDQILAIDGILTDSDYTKAAPTD